MASSDQQPPPPPPSNKLGTSKPSPSFRLRNQSLNTLRLRRIFDLFDRNSDGLITPSELSLALDALGLSPTSPSDVSLLVSPFLHPPGSSGLDFPAFQALHRSLGDALFGADDDNSMMHPDDQNQEDDDEEEEEEEMAEAFKVFDEDGDGFISAKELQTVLGKLGLEEGKSLEMVKDMIVGVDSDKDGRVDFHEFKNMMQNIVVRS